MSTDNSELDATIAALGLEYSARFVPQSQSRNAKEEQPSLNWVVTLKKGRATLTTDYLQGIGYLPEAFRKHIDSLKMGSAARHRIERVAAETGKTGRFLSSLEVMFSQKPIPAPSLRDVLYCLVSDASVLDHATFESWASEYGNDPDSRSAEKTYRACLEIALQLRALIGDFGIGKLQEAFQDY